MKQELQQEQNNGSIDLADDQWGKYLRVAMDF